MKTFVYRNIGLLTILGENNKKSPGMVIINKRSKIDFQHQRQSVECEQSLSYQNMHGIIRKIRVSLTFLFFTFEQGRILVNTSMMV